MLQAMGYYLAADAILSIAILGLLYWKRDFYRHQLRAFLFPAPVLATSAGSMAEEDEDECDHSDELDHGYCIDCGEFVQSYDMEHDSGDMER